MTRRFRMLCFRMEPTSKLASLNRTVSTLWNEVSSAFAALLIFASLALLGYWALTGDSLLSATEPSTNAAKLQQGLVMMLSCCISSFLATYVLNCPIRGCASLVLLSLHMLLSGGFIAFALPLVPTVIGGCAGKYFNAYVSGRGDSRLAHTSFRAVILGICVLLAFLFVPNNKLPFWCGAIVWILLCSIYLSGAIRSIWQRYPVAQAAG